MDERGRDEVVTDDADSISVRLRDRRRDVDVAAMEQTRARVANQLFGVVESARLGRFVLGERIASGGMGVVYAAEDTHLGRRVALKLLHPQLQATERARARFLMEARVLAKLDHPNVVPVHDVVEIDGSIVIVMELVEGASLVEWQRKGRRSWREIVAVYVQAGRGLAAAHARNVIHRDFKPSNTIVGDDGRVRVLDFGLAQLAEGAGDAADPNARGASPTETDELVGTRGFVAPEVLSGAPASAASDQYSFCVALHRALAHRRVPRRVRVLVERGLASRPDERHATLAALLDPLSRQRTARPLAVAATAMIATTAAAIAWPRDADPLAACDGGVHEIGAIWNLWTRAQLHAAFLRIRAPNVGEIADKVLADLERYRADWIAAHRDACVSHRQGTVSDTLLDRRMECQRQRLGDLAGSIRVLTHVEPSTMWNATGVVAGMPSLAACSDQALLGETLPFASEHQRSQAAALRTELGHAAALQRAGRAREAAAAARAGRELAERLAYPPVLVEAALLEGKVLLFRRELRAAIAPLELARRTALANNLTAEAVIASARLIYIEGSIGADPARVRRELELVDPLSEALRGDRFARPLLLNNAGAFAMARGERDEARRLFLRAHELVETIPSPDLELINIDKNLAMLTAGSAERAGLARAVWTRLRDSLGPWHPQTLEALYSYGHYIDDPAQSRPLIREACESYDRHHPDLIKPRADCGFYLAFLTSLDEPGAARAAYAKVAALAPGATDATARIWTALALGYLELEDGAHAAARARFAGLIESLQHSGTEWWIRQLLAHASAGAGLAAAGLRDERDARKHLELAMTIYESNTRVNEDCEHRQRLELVQGTLIRLRAQ